MAFTDFTPKTEIQFSQDSKSIKIIDKSAWDGEEDNCTSALIQIFYFDKEYNMSLIGSHNMISGGDRDDFNEYISDDGFILDVSEISSVIDRFEDGYYIVKTTYDDDSYSYTNMPYYENHQANLAKYRCMIRKLPIKFLSWPEIDYKEHEEIQLIRILIDAAEDAVDLGKKERFNTIITTMNLIFDKYEISECF